MFCYTTTLNELNKTSTHSLFTQPRINADNIPPPTLPSDWVLALSASSPGFNPQVKDRVIPKTLQKQYKYLHCLTLNIKRETLALSHK